MGDNEVILKTVLEYYLDRNREFRKLTDELRTCCCFPTRKKIKQRLDELNTIINRDKTISKYHLMLKLGIKYKEVKNYPELIEIQNKQRELKRMIKVNAA